MGEALLWHMATKLKNPVITARAAYILIDLHVSEDRSVKLSRGSAHVESASERRRMFFLEKCFNELSFSVSALRGPGSKIVLANSNLGKF